MPDGTLTLTPPPGPDDHALGPDDAPVVLVEYGDYECPYCGRAHEILQDVLWQLRDRVRFVYRNYPLTDVHPRAQAAAEAAESVAAHGGNGAFWDMHDILFENQDALEIDDLLGYADAAGAGAEDVADDLSSGAQRARVRRDVESGEQSDVRGTPTFFVNGKRFEGDWTDPDGFADVLERAAFTGRLA